MRRDDPVSSAIENLTAVREHLANERTLLSWIRLGLAITALGFVVARFGIFVAELLSLQPVRSVETSWSVPIGVALVLAGPCFAGLALRRYLQAEHEIDLGRYHPHHDLLFAMIIATALIGLGLAVYLVVIATEITHTVPIP